MRAPSLFRRVVAYLTGYVTFPNPDHASALALWCMGTHVYPHVDTFPYLAITADTKRAGKSLTAELAGALCANARNITGATPAAVFQLIRDESPTIIMDEAEAQQSEAAGDLMRALLNSGYRRGQTIPRVAVKGVVEWPTYCPKAFVLIGDVRDTLRDRSIVVRLKRADPARRYVRSLAMMEGHVLRDEIAELATAQAGAVARRYQDHPGLPFLPSSRDEELWVTLATVAETMAPELAADLPRLATDLCVEKTAPARKVVTLAGAEEEAESEEYGLRLLRDLVSLMDGRGYLTTADALAALHALPTAPWRRFRGDGLTAIDMGNLLARFGVRSRNKKHGRQVLKAYLAADCRAALPG